MRAISVTTLWFCDYQVDADSVMAAVQPEADSRDEQPTPQQQTEAVVSSVADTAAAAADSADGPPVSPVLPDSEDAEEEQADHDGAALAALETGSASGDTAGEADAEALEIAEGGTDDDENEQPSPVSSDKDIIGVAQISTSTEGTASGEAELSSVEARSSDEAEATAGDSPSAAEEEASEGQDELLVPVPSALAEAMLQADHEQHDAASIGASDAVAAAPEEEQPAEGSAVVEEDDSPATASAAMETAADGGQTSDESSPDSGFQAPALPRQNVPAWRRAHDAAAADDAGETPVIDSAGVSA